MNLYILNKLRNNIYSLGRPFYFLWCGETISLLGIALMEFALGVWVYQKTGSVLDFSGVIAASILPTLLILPFAGKIADRFDRRIIMISADITTAGLLCILAFLLWKGSLELTHLYAFNVLASISGSFRGAAYAVSASQLIEKEKYTHASGLIGMSSNLVSMFAPMLAGWLMANIGLTAIVYIDLVTFCVGSLCILKAFFYFGKTGKNKIPQANSKSSGSFKVAKIFFKNNPLMLGLFFYVILLNAALSLVSIMMMPMILSHYSAQELGVILGFGAAGGLCGTLLLASLPPPKYLMPIILKGDALLSLCIVLIGLTTNFIIYCICTLLAMFIVGYTKGCSQALWMKKVPLEKRGRIFSVLGSTILATTLLVLLFGGIVADEIFEVALSDGGRLSSTLGPWIGTGKGRGLGLMFIVAGVVGLFISLGALRTSILHLDLKVSDAK